MTKEEKNLLLKDICARLPYGVKCSFGVDDAIYKVCGVNPTCCGASEIQATHIKNGINGDFTLNSCKPYLYPISSMTEEQKDKYQWLCVKVPIYEQYYEEYEICGYEYEDTWASMDWLNENHFDYKELIPMGLAIDATGLNIY